MNFNELNQFLVNALKIADDIAVKYKELRTMEISGLIDAPLYKNVFIELKNKQIEEKKLYNEASLEKRDIHYLMKTIIKTHNIKKMPIIEDILHREDFKFNFFERTLLILKNMLDYDENEKIESLGIINQLIPSNVLLKQIKDNFGFNKAALYNFYKAFMSLLNNYIKTSDLFKNDFIHIKYLLPFLYPDLLQEFNKDFNSFNDNFILFHTMVGDMYKMPSDVQQHLLNSIIFSKFAIESDRLLEISNKDFEKKRLNVMLSEILMKSSTIFFNESFLESRKKLFDNYMSKNYLSYLNYQSSINSILSVYNLSKKDKSNFKYLSLKR